MLSDLQRVRPRTRMETEVERLAGRARDQETAELRRVVATLGVER